MHLTVAVSGAGRSLKNLWNQSQGKNYQISGVVASSATCEAYEWAKQKGIATFVYKSGLNNSDSGKELIDFTRDQKTDLIILAGFLKKFPVTLFAGTPIINIHPSLLPKYGGKGMYGIHVHKAVAASEDLISGATVHEVTEEYDKGKILGRSKVLIPENRDPECIARRVFESEKKLLPLVTEKLLEAISRDTYSVWQTIELDLTVDLTVGLAVGLAEETGDNSKADPKDHESLRNAQGTLKR